MEHVAISIGDLDCASPKTTRPVHQLLKTAANSPGMTQGPMTDLHIAGWKRARKSTDSGEAVHAFARLWALETAGRGERVLPPPWPGQKLPVLQLLQSLEIQVGQYELRALTLRESLC